MQVLPLRSSKLWVPEKPVSGGKWDQKSKLLQFKDTEGSCKCPWSAPTTKVQKDALPIASKVTVRIVTPQAYRQFFLPEGEEDSPASIISLAAQHAKIPVAVLTGGRWSKQYLGNKPQTTGFLRVSAAAAEKLLKISGDHGIFFTKVQEEANNPKPSFFGFGKKPSESSESYFRRCKVLASEREQPLVLRTGGGSDLGCLRKNTDSNECRPCSLWSRLENQDTSCPFCYRCLGTHEQCFWQCPQKKEIMDKYPRDFRDLDPFLKRPGWLPFGYQHSVLHDMFSTVTRISKLRQPD